MPGESNVTSPQRLASSAAAGAVTATAAAASAAASRAMASVSVAEKALESSNLDFLPARKKIAMEATIRASLAAAAAMRAAEEASVAAMSAHSAFLHAESTRLSASLAIKESDLDTERELLVKEFEAEWERRDLMNRAAMAGGKVSP